MPMTPSMSTQRIMQTRSVLSELIRFISCYADPENVALLKRRSARAPSKICRCKSLSLSLSLILTSTCRRIGRRSKEEPS